MYGLPQKCALRSKTHWRFHCLGQTSIHTHFFARRVLLSINAPESFFAVLRCSADVLWLNDCLRHLVVRGGCSARHFRSAHSPPKAIKVLRVGPVFRRVPVAFFIVVGDFIAIAIVLLLIKLQRRCKAKA